MTNKKAVSEEGERERDSNLGPKTIGLHGDETKKKKTHKHKQDIKMRPLNFSPANFDNFETATATQITMDCQKAIRPTANVYEKKWGKPEKKKTKAKRKKK